MFKAGVKIYGGFVGTETSLAGRQGVATPCLHETILSGDLDDSGPNDAYHVVISANPVGTALLDGFTITGGNANDVSDITVNGQAIAQEYGGGMYNYVSSKPTLTNCILWGNTTRNGYYNNVYNEGSTPTLC